MARKFVSSCVLFTFILGSAQGSSPPLWGEGLPSAGHFDSFHPSLGKKVSTSQGSEELVKTVMALRVIKVEELLDARKGYLELLPPGDHHSPYLKVPEGVQDVFANGEKIVQISHLVRDIEKGSESPAEERELKRKKVFEALTLEALSLSQMDRLIRFLSEEIFEGNASYTRMVKRSMETMMLEGRGFVSKKDMQQMRERAHQLVQEELRNKLAIPEILENLLAQRTFLLNRHPLLGVKFKGCSEFYRCLYEDLRKKFRLPNLNRAMSSGDIDFEQVSQIDISSSDERRLQKNLEILSDNQEELLELVTPLFNKAIRVALEGNFDFLHDLCREAYFWDNTTPYFLMALDENNWTKLLEGDQFFWMERRVFEKGKEELIELVEREGDRQRLRDNIFKYIARGTMALGALSMMAGWGVGAAIMEGPVGCLK